MNEIKTYKRLAWGLVILNILIFLFFLFLNRPHLERNQDHHDHGGPKEKIQNQLQFDDAQKLQYQKLIAQHIIEVREQENKINNIRQDLYNYQLQSKDSQDIEGELCEAITEMEFINIHHIQEIRKICNEKQQKLFEDIGEDWSKIFKPHPPKK